MKAEPQEFYDELKRDRAKKQIAALSIEVCEVIAWAMGWSKTNAKDVPEYLQEINNKMRY